MASTYTRKDSPFIHIRFKDEHGQWKGRRTGYRKDNPGDRIQAELIAKEESHEERALHATFSGGEWGDWVDRWIDDRYAKSNARTYALYRQQWTRLYAWLKKEGVTAPHQLTFNSCLRYKLDRERKRKGRSDEKLISTNTIIHELKFLGLVMQEAIRRGLATNNPCHKMGLKHEPQKHKDVWTQVQIAAVASVIHMQPDWMQASFILGLYQAARLRQCEVPLSDIDLERRRIVYWKTIHGRPLTKGDKPFAQPIAASALPLLRDLIARRRAAGSLSLCDMPQTPSLDWRRFLDSLGGCENISHHGLRATWITRAALSRESISREEAKRFVNHGSTSVHEIYQRLNADDVAHVADALALPAFEPQSRPSPIP